VAARQVLYQRKRRAQGLCGYNGCKIIVGLSQYYCDAHYAVIRSHRSRRKAAAAVAA
jgi:hypothetical protein